MNNNLPPLLVDLPPLLVKKRYHDLDALRGFAMSLGIVLHGLLSFIPGFAMPGQDIYQSAAYAFALDAIHGFRMPLFFLVSGFFTTMMWRNRGLGGLFKHRAQRVALPMVVFLALLLPLLIPVAIFAEVKKAQLPNRAEIALRKDAFDAGSGDATPPDWPDNAGEVVEALLPEGLQLGAVIDQLPGLVQILVLIFCFGDAFHHMWFLYYLIWFVLGFIAVAWTAQRLKWRSVPAWFVASPLRLLWLIPITFVPQFFMTMAFGPDTASGLVPWPPKMLYYAIFFGFGAVCFGNEAFEKRVGRFWPICFALAVPALLLGLHWLGARRGAYYAAGNSAIDSEFLVSHLLCTALTVLYTWLMIFGFIGFFRRFFSGENRHIRYLSDSSYWLYLMHLPLILFLQILVSDWPYPSFVKFTCICALTTGSLLLIYEFMVRYTLIGTMLNGKKTRTRILPPLPATAHADLER